jgi:hypothetical protein
MLMDKYIFTSEKGLSFVFNAANLNMAVGSLIFFLKQGDIFTKESIADMNFTCICRAGGFDVPFDTERVNRLIALHLNSSPIGYNR